MKTTYWAVKLNEESTAVLLAKFPAIHSNVFAHHMTIVYDPSKNVDNELMKECGTEVVLEVIGYAKDEKGQAVVVKSNSINRIGGGVAHITISCANGTNPVYSNKLLKKHWDQIALGIKISGVIARSTDKGWDSTKKDSLNE